MADTLIAARRVYGDERYVTALRRLGDFLVLAQMPDSQPAWAQQYDYDMHPIWARRFEPPAVAGDESQEVVETLMKIATATGDDTYLAPIPRALAYLKTSLLPDGRLARYYELRTNRPLYMQRHGKSYELTYDESHLPGHYGWKWVSRHPSKNGRGTGNSTYSSGESRLTTGSPSRGCDATNRRLRARPRRPYVRLIDD